MEWALFGKIAPYMVSAGGAVAYGLAWRLRKANTNKVNVEVSKMSQEIYQGIIADLRNEVENLKQQVYMLTKIVEKNKQDCDACPNKKR